MVDFTIVLASFMGFGIGLVAIARVNDCLEFIDELSNIEFGGY